MIYEKRRRLYMIDELTKRGAEVVAFDPRGFRQRTFTDR